MRTHTINTQLGPITVLDDFPAAEIPMYAHRVVRDVEGRISHNVGDVVYTKRVRDPRNLLQAEQFWIAEKAAKYRWFPYPPSECLTHEWTPIFSKKGRLMRLPAMQGCDDCRERAASPKGKELKVEAAGVPPVSPVAPVAPLEASGGVGAAVPPPAAEAIPAAQCPYCGWTSKARTKTVRRQSLKQHLKRCKP